jgi:hypothetical protein
MKQFLTIVFILAVVSGCFAMSTNDIIQLAKLHTSEELMINVIQRSGLDHPLTTQEIIQLKEAGVTERVIQYLLKLSTPETEKLPGPEGESVQVSKNMRVYQTRDKNGKIITVATNLDENGKRIGGELPPPEPESVQPEPQYPEYAPQEPREVYVTVRHENEYPDEGYGPPPEAYSPYDYSPYGYSPYYGGYPSYSTAYYPSVGFPNCPPKNHFGNSYFPNGVTWQIRSQPPKIATSRPTISRPAPSTPSPSAGFRPRQIRH